jgi:putative transposase
LGFCGSPKTGDLCRKQGISEATFYSWKSKFGGLDVSKAKRLERLEGDTVQLRIVRCTLGKTG